jgi:tetratricopeptide (TPR) repeat protein
VTAFASFVVAALGATSAIAQDAGVADGSAAAPVSSSVAEQEYDRAIALYAKGKKLEALQAMQECYRLSRRVDLLYNIGKLQRELGRCVESLASYRDYVQREPTGPSSELSRAAIRELEGICATPEPSPRYFTAPRIVGWSSVLAGVGAGIAGVVFEVNAHASADEERRLAATSGVSWGSVNQRAQDARREQALGIVFGALGGAFITGGVLCLTLWAPGGTKEKGRSGVAVAIHPGGALVDYAVSF